MNNTNIDTIVNNLVYEALTGGPRNSITDGDSSKAYLANELVAGAAAFAHSVPGGVFTDLQAMVGEQTNKVYEDETSIGYLMQKLQESDLTEVAEMIEEICTNPLEEDADHLHEIAGIIKDVVPDSFIVEQIHKFAEDVRHFGRLNENGYDVNHFITTGEYLLLEEAAPVKDAADETPTSENAEDETDAL